MAGDPSWNSVVLLLHGDAIDKSSVGKAISVYGGAAVSASRLTTGELSFSGPSYFSFADHVDFELGNGDFTIDLKFYLTGYSALSGADYGSCLIGKDVTGSRGYSLIINGTVSSYTGLTFAGFSSNSVSISVPITYSFALNTEYSVRVVRSGNLLYIFVNGVLQNVGGTAFNLAIQDTTSQLKIGAFFYDAGVTYNYYVNGCMREVRLTKGVARSTANYTVDTAPFQDGMGQVNGTVLDAAGAPAARTVRAYRRDTGALVKELFTLGPDPYFSNVVLLLHGNGVNGSTVFKDSSASSKTLTLNDNAKISTTQSKFGGASMAFDGAGDFATAADHADFELGSGDFTIEGWVRLNGYSSPNGVTYASCIVSKDSSVSRGFNFNITGTAAAHNTLEFAGYSSNSVGTTVTAAHSFSNGVWYHVAVCRSGNLLFLFVDGILKNPGGTAFSLAVQDTTSSLHVAGLIYGDPYYYYFNGNINDLRITKGVARYTASFAPPVTMLQDAGAGALGDYSFYTPTLDELDVIALDNATSGTYYDDQVIRVIPA